MAGNLKTDSRDGIDAQMLNNLQDLGSGAGGMTGKQGQPWGSLNTHSGTTPRWTLVEVDIILRIMHWVGILARVQQNGLDEGTYRILAGEGLHPSDSGACTGETIPGVGLLR
jgi:hypothetical protein